MKSFDAIASGLEDYGALKMPEVGGPNAQPKERLVSADAARGKIKNVFDSTEHQRRLTQYRAVQDSYDRIPPDTLEELAYDGVEGLANANWGGLQTAIDEAVEQYVALALDPSEFIQFSATNMGQNGAGGDGLLELAKAHARLMRDWQDLEDTFCLMLHYMVAHGLGIFHWPHPNSWQFRALHPGNLIYPQRAPLNPSQWSWCAVLTEFAIPDLIRVLDPDAKDSAKEKGWDIQAVEDAIRAYQDGEGAKRPDREDIERILYGFENENVDDLDEGHTIKGFIFYIREHDGSVSEYWLSDQNGVDCLFKRNGRYRNMGSVLSIFPLGLGDGFLGRVRGYGINSLPYHDLEDRHNNRIIDQSWVSSSIGLKGDQESLNRTSDLLIGPFFHVPEEMNIEQIAFANQTQSLFEATNLFETRKAARNKGMGGGIDTTPGVDRTATGARLRYQEQTQARGGAISRFYRRLTTFYTNLWSRIADPDADENDPGVPEARRMLLEALGKGLPLETLASIRTVTAKRIFGNGDHNELFLALMDLAPFFGRLSAGGQQLFLRYLYTARLRNAPEVESMLVQPEVDDVEQRERQQAAGENADAQTSDVALPVAATDNHRIHGGEHIVFAEDTVTQFENNRIPLEQAHQTLTRIREHSLGHLEWLSQDPQSEPIFRDLNNRFASIDNMIKRTTQMLEDKQQAQAEQQLEELRNPRPSVDEIEKAQTEAIKRDLMIKESDAKIETMQRESRAKTNLMEAEALMKQATAASSAQGEIFDQAEIPRGPGTQQRGEVPPPIPRSPESQT